MLFSDMRCCRGPQTCEGCCVVMFKKCPSGQNVCVKDVRGMASLKTIRWGVGDA